MGVSENDNQVQNRSVSVRYDLMVEGLLLSNRRRLVRETASGMKESAGRGNRRLVIVCCECERTVKDDPRD